MKPILTSLFLAALATASLAHEMTVGSLTIEHPWIVQDATGEDRAYGYLKIVNSGDADRLMNAATYDAVGVTLQLNEIANDVEQNINLPNGVVVPSGQVVEFKPGSYRVLLTDLRRKFDAGEMVSVVLTFEKAGPVTLEFEVTE